MQPIDMKSEFKDPGSSRADALEKVLQQFENQLNPSQPENGPMAAQVIACGEVSAVLTLKALPGRVCKRMSGFETEDQVGIYIDLVQQYCGALETLGVAVVPTELVPVRSAVKGFVVYILQPDLPKEELGNQILKTGTDDHLFFVVSEFLKTAEKIFSYNHTNTDNRLIAVDSQISNWHVTKQKIRLLDVGTPCLRQGKKDLFDSKIIGKAIPLPIRFVFDRANMFQTYFDSYFSPREIIVDHVANYIKEGRPDRIPKVLKFIHQWIFTHGNHLKSTRKISLTEIKKFYRKDVILLETFLQCRRLDRFIKTRVLARPYDYILPGKIHRF